MKVKIWFVDESNIPIELYNKREFEFVELDSTTKFVSFKLDESGKTFSVNLRSIIAMDISP